MGQVIVLHYTVTAAAEGGWRVEIVDMHGGTGGPLQAAAPQSHATHRETAIRNCKAMALGLLAMYVESSPHYADVGAVVFAPLPETDIDRDYQKRWEEGHA